MPADDPSARSSEPIVPATFAAPPALDTSRFRLRPLGPEHNESDHAAWTSSIEHIHATPGFEASSWPTPMTLEENLRDLEGHARDFEQRTGFTYTVLRPEADEVIGCVYIYPARTGPGIEVRSWVRQADADLDKPLYQAVIAWMTRDWPFGPVVYAERP
jgi:RimJ/RimL family protein N-acetyltransferase